MTLEPCSSQGRTPPCTEAILAAGIRRVVACTADPDARHAGRGFAALRAAGALVTCGGLAREATRLNERFFAWTRARLPHVTVKLAMSLDGQLAPVDRSSRWITGEAARQRAHELRAASDAVLVGIGTVLADDPRLNVRLEGRPGRAPLRCVLDPDLRTPSSARLLAPVVGDEPGGPVVLFTAEAAGAARAQRARVLEAAGATIVSLPRAAGGGLDLPALLAHLGQERRGSGQLVTSLLVEGGGATAGSFLAARVVDRVVLHVAPLVLFGGATADGQRGVPAFAAPAAASLAQGLRLKGLEVEQLGCDVSLTGVTEHGFDPDEAALHLAALGQGA